MRRALEFSWLPLRHSRACIFRAVLSLVEIIDHSQSNKASFSALVMYMYTAAWPYYAKE